nr:preQ(1) synthase [uncultured Campylobacter sp.]
MDYAPEVLETFENKHPENDYWVRFNCPEFTSLCPITGQPDFAEIRISYVPNVRMVESKSLKLYLFSFRNHGDGQIQAKFDDKLELLNKTDFDGRKVALIGVGNVERHGSDFCSGMSAFLPVLKKADLIGAWGAEGYKFKHSRAFINGKFVGLTIDFKGDEHWQARADKWIAAVKGEF